MSVKLKHLIHILYDHCRIFILMSAFRSIGILIYELVALRDVDEIFDIIFDEPSSRKLAAQILEKVFSFIDAKYSQPSD